MEQLPDVLRLEAARLGVPLDPKQVSLLEEHLHLLAQWNAKLNLVGPAPLTTWARRHTLDSLAAARWVKEGASVIDVGSGAGFPGVPLAIAEPGARVLLLEPRANRSAFLINVVARLRLHNVSVRTGRAEDEAARFDLVVGRAVMKLPAWVSLATKLCAPGGRFVVFAMDPPPERLGQAVRRELQRYAVGAGPPRSLACYVPRGT